MLIDTLSRLRVWGPPSAGLACVCGGGGMEGRVLPRSAVLRVASVSGTLAAAQECVYLMGGWGVVIADRLESVLLSVLVRCTQPQSRPVFVIASLCLS